MAGKKGLKEAVECASGSTPWDLGNEVLYDLCNKYPCHKEDQAILAKVWLIGRSYAAAIERRRPDDMEKKEDNDDFYIQTVLPKIKGSAIDQWIEGLKKYQSPTTESLNDILTVHANVTNLFAEISNLQKRSLASKYLHFHLRELFFIYDTRAVSKINRLSGFLNFQKSNSNNENIDKHDHEYHEFVEKCLHLQSYIENQFSIFLNPRQIDNLLLMDIECTI